MRAWPQGPPEGWTGGWVGGGAAGRWQRSATLLSRCPPLEAAATAAVGGWLGLQAWAWGRGLRRAAVAPLPVISVGGLEVGGSGKTPVTGWLLAWLRARGVTAGLGTRGYGRPTRRLVLRRPGEAADWRQLGDEAAMQVQGGLDVLVAACPSRLAGARALAAAGAEVVVLDDAFSHRRLARQLDVVVLDAAAPLGQPAALVPRGRLREPPAALARADVVWLHDRRPAPPPPPPAPPSALAALAPGALFVASRQWLGPAVSAAGQPVALAGQRLWLVAAIAKPAAFVAAVRAAGATVAGATLLPDHAPYGVAAAAAVAARARAAAAAAVLTTAKDAVKLRAVWPAAGPPLWVAPVRLQVVAGQAALLERLAAALGGRPGPAVGGRGPGNTQAAAADTPAVQP